jgi:hypothetical protein
MFFLVLGDVRRIFTKFCDFYLFLGIFRNFSFLWHFRPFVAILLCFGGILGNFVVLPFFFGIFALFRTFSSFLGFSCF